MVAHSPTPYSYVRSFISAIAIWGMIFNAMQAPHLKQHARNQTSNSNESEERDKIMQYMQMVQALAGAGLDRASPTSDDACTSNVATLDTQSICT